MLCLGKGRFTRSNFWPQLLLKLNEANDTNQNFNELKQCAMEYVNQKNFRPLHGGANVTFLRSNPYKSDSKLLASRFHNAFFRVCKCSIVW